MAKKSSSKAGIGAAVGLGLAAAGAVGAYFLYGKQGKENRKKIRSWALKAKGDVLQKVERLKNLDKTSYYKAIDDVIARYGKLKEVSKEELAGLGRELKGHWNQIQKDFTSSSGKTSTRKRTTKKNTPQAE